MDASTEPSLLRLFEEGRRAWPGLELAPEVFVRHFGRAGSFDPAPPAGRAADLYLACACAAGAPGAIEAFERAHLRSVGAYLARMRPSRAFLDDVLQSVRERLFVGREGRPPRIAEYDGKGALASWVRVIVLRIAIDLRERSPEAVEGPETGQKDAAATDPEIGYLKDRYREAFNAAVRGAITSLARDQRALLRLQLVDGLTLDRIAEVTGVHRATVARRLAAAREAVAEEAHRLLREALGADSAELTSLAGMLRSEIDLSLPGLLGASPPPS